MAVTASLVNNTCHPSLSSAANAYFSSLPASTSASGTDTIVIENIYYPPLLAWTLKKTTYSAAGVPTFNFWVVVNPPPFPDCDATAPYFDGMQIGWGVVAAMAAALSVIFIKKAFFR